MSPLYMVLSVVFMLGCAGFVAIILLQKKRSAGLGNIAGMGSSQTYWDKNKGRSMEGTLEKYTKICGAAFFLFSFIMCFVK